MTGIDDFHLFVQDDPTLMHVHKPAIQKKSTITKNERKKRTQEEIERLKKENEKMDARISCAIEDIEDYLAFACPDECKDKFESILYLLKGGE